MLKTLAYINIYVVTRRHFLFSESKLKIRKLMKKYLLVDDDDQKTYISDR